MSDAALEEWERCARRYGELARFRPARLLRGELTADLEDLRLAMTRHRSASALRTLTRVTAQMCGLMCLILIKLDDQAAWRGWARTARTAAEEAGDPATRSWVLAQEAYGHYYGGHLTEAVRVSRQAQQVESACVGAVLAAALEARAQAVLAAAPRGHAEVVSQDDVDAERARQAHGALAHAEQLLASLPAEDVNRSAIGYNEAQLRFHASNALTHLGRTAEAWEQQERALHLVPAEDYTDHALTRLDRTMCLIRDGATSDALQYAAATLEPLTSAQREGIIAARGRDVLNALAPAQRASSAARQLRELLTP